MPVVRHRTETVEGLDAFSRESGPVDAPVLESHVDEVVRIIRNRSPR